jgi:hypothetical protein
LGGSAFSTFKEGCVRPKETENFSDGGLFRMLSISDWHRSFSLSMVLIKARGILLTLPT